MTNINQAIQDFTEQKLSGAVLRRALINYAQWNVPLQEQDPKEVMAGKKPKPRLFVDSDGKNNVFFFTEADAIKPTADKLNIDFSGLSLTTNGDWAFRSLPSKTDILNIATPSGSIHYTAEQLKQFPQWVKEAQVELALSEVLQKPEKEFFQRIASFDSYWIVLLQTPNGAYPALAPDTKDRKLLAVFTASETMEAFLQYLERSSPAMQTLVSKQEGVDLFLYISRLSEIDGIVFNCMGPVAPAAFQPAFAAAVLKANPGLTRRAAFRKLLMRSTFALQPEELASLTEEQNKEILALFYLAMAADGKITEDEQHFLREVIAQLPWKWGRGQAHTLEIGREIAEKFSKLPPNELRDYVNNLCRSLPETAPRQKIFIGLFAQMLSDGNFEEKEVSALQKYAALLSLSEEQELISQAVRLLAQL